MTQELATVRDAAGLLRCSISTVRRLIRSGRLGCVQLPGTRLIRIRQKDLDSYLKRKGISIAGHPQKGPGVIHGRGRNNQNSRD